MRAAVLLTISLILFMSVKAQDFYDLNTIQTIKITFAEDNWDQLLDAEKMGDENYIMAQSIDINGEVLDSIGVKYKGNSTYSSNQTKNPFHIELDTYKEQDYDGYSDIKLSNVAKDPSFLREVLSYQVLGQYMDAPLSNYANVYVNDDLIGLYSNSEAVSKKFVKSRFGSKTNTFIKCNPIDGAGQNSTDLPSLEYLGQDSADYYEAYEMKSDEGWIDLINLCDTLENDMEAIEQILDVDRVLWMLAFDNVVVNLDSYIGQFTQNYYLYRDDNNRFVPVVWDLNESFGQFTSTGSGNLNSTTAKQQMDPLLHENDADFPLVKNLLNVPMYKRMYLAHCKTILLENFDNNAYYGIAEELQTLIDESVQNDNNKFYTYNNFISNLNDDISGGGGPGGGSSSPGISNLMDGRSSYLLAQSEFTQEAPSISDLEVSEENPTVGQSISLSAAVENATTVYYAYRVDQEDKFIRMPMFDDGEHGDSEANDGVYGVFFAIDAVFTQYYIYAENDAAGMFSPQRAEHEYHQILASLNDVEVGDIVINELMASNSSTISDQDGEFDDWIELFNNSTESIDISGYSLSDDQDELNAWSFPEGTVLEPNAYIIVWADKDEDQTGFHATFKLSSDSETLFLSDNTGAVIDEISFYNQGADVSYGRYPNGTGAFQGMASSFSSENGNTTSINDNDKLDNESLHTYPNPCTNQFSIELDDDGLNTQTLFVYNMLGSVVYTAFVSGVFTVETSEWDSGLYIVKIDNKMGKVFVE